MIRINSRNTIKSLRFIRYNSSSTTPSQQTTASISKASIARPEAIHLNKKDLQNNEFAQQAPNRDVTWSQSQEPRIDVISKFPYRFTQRDLAEQPRPYAAIDLIAKEPIRYLTHEEGNIAVCDGNKGDTLQGHPKVFINLDKPKASTCGYCGLRYAKEEFKEIIEAGEAK
ncbi:uncharacterized protein KGF55_005503 [Candida pseudojiufengensis]|uniref:uncharacterized protein n=1 Tax=Candida pseudojiufengensis TaxID=497109 RepID=UPI0022243BA3|nr:uncharacterized protein KGF55_005503 [Candida pseudojiufengensis]KAI5959160.1 hypothetical protein KGF55_005503 [Candida pseudojiufengensis]